MHPLCIVACLFALLNLTASVTPHADDNNLRVKRTDDVSLSSLQTLVEQQASMLQTVLAEQAASKNRISSLEGLVNSQQASITSLQAIVAPLQASVTSLQASVTSLQANVTSLQARVDATARAVAFSARLSRDQDSSNHGASLGQHQIIQFNDAITNIGDAYDVHSGIFTAPVAGSYAFFLSQMTPNQHTDLELGINKNGVTNLDIVFTESGVSDSYDQGSSLVTTHLATGDRVWVQQVYGDGVRAGYWSIFSGFLVQAD